MNVWLIDCSLEKIRVSEALANQSHINMITEFKKQMDYNIQQFGYHWESTILVNS